MKISELKESRYTDPQKFLKYLAGVFNDNDPNNSAYTMKGDAPDVVGYVFDIRHGGASNEWIGDHVYRVLKRLFGETKVIHGLGKVGWQVGPYFVTYSVFRKEAADVTVYLYSKLMKNEIE